MKVIGAVTSPAYNCTNTIDYVIESVRKVGYVAAGRFHARVRDSTRYVKLYHQGQGRGAVWWHSIIETNFQI